MIYLGNFLFLTNQEASDVNERRHGSFNLVVNADDEATAVAFFKTTAVASSSAFTTRLKLPQWPFSRPGSSSTAMRAASSKAIVRYSSFT